MNDGNCCTLLHDDPSTTRRLQWTSSLILKHSFPYGHNENRRSSPSKAGNLKLLCQEAWQPLPWSKQGQRESTKLGQAQVSRLSTRGFKHSVKDALATLSPFIATTYGNEVQVESADSDCYCLTHSFYNSTTNPLKKP